ncbi:MAG: LicD family protein, partial [Propionibacteriales bacterium]|nr:LicD family protein [Propionibacteriales bacterium]
MARRPVGQAGLNLPAHVTVTCDVHFDGRRVWSFAPTDFDTERSQRRFVPWPRLLLPWLRGTTTVSVVEHLSGVVALIEEHDFGGAEAGTRVRLETAAGAPQVVDKWGFIQHSFDDRGPEDRARLVDVAEQILQVLAKDCDLPAWVAFGSLLGAVREGGMIGHDSDVDIAYLSKHENPVDVAREMFAVSRALRAADMSVATRTGSFCAVTPPRSQGRWLPPIDVYACFYVGDTLYETASVGQPIPREAVLPLTTVQFEGRALPAPADPEVMLEASYGPNWRIPDPAFAYRTP